MKKNMTVKLKQKQEAMTLRMQKEEHESQDKPKKAKAAATRAANPKKTIRMDIHPNAPSFGTAKKNAKIKDLQEDNATLARQNEMSMNLTGGLKMSLSESSTLDDVDLAKQCIMAMLEGLEIDMPEDLMETVSLDPAQFYLLGSSYADKLWEEGQSKLEAQFQLRQLLGQFTQIKKGRQFSLLQGGKAAVEMQQANN